MKKRPSVRRAWILVLLLFLPSLKAAAEQLQPKTLKAWETYVPLTEQRIQAEVNNGKRFLATDFLGQPESQAARALLRSGRVYIRKMATTATSRLAPFAATAGDQDGKPIRVESGMIHHWLGGIFLPGARLDALLPWIQDYDHHSKYFQEVERSRLVAREGDVFRIFYRLRRKKIITVYYNSEHTVVYRRHSPTRVSSRSFTTRIAQLEDAGTPAEKEKPVGNDSGFLWRLNSYWRFREEDGGIYVECESLSLSRSIPAGLAWLIRGYVESVPRESLENTLTSIRDGFGKKAEALLILVTK